jgi:XTP/dITP diphosphohydrolase
MTRFSRLLLATRNADKVTEIKQALSSLHVDIIAADEIPELPAVVEDSSSLEGNALKKALTLSHATGLLTLADDTGLEVDALNGAPGVHTSRYAGEKASYDDNVDKLLSNLKDIPLESRTARFRCVIAIVYDNYQKTVMGICEGLILDHRQGSGGFGYDPVFFVPETRCTMAELSVEEKNKISHRGLALKKSLYVLEHLLA